MPQGLRPAQQPLRSGDFLHLRNKRTQQLSCIQHGSPSPPLSQALHGRPVGAQPAPWPVLVCESAASTKHGGHCVPALVTQWFVRNRVCMILAQKLYSSV